MLLMLRDRVREMYWVLLVASRQGRSKTTTLQQVYPLPTTCIHHASSISFL